MKPPENGRFADIFTANQESITSAPMLALAEESHRSLPHGQKYIQQILTYYRNTQGTDLSCKSAISVYMCLQKLCVSAAKLATRSRSNSKTTRPGVTLLVLLLLASLLLCLLCYPLPTFLWSDILKHKPRWQVMSQGIYGPTTVWENVWKHTDYIS